MVKIKQILETSALVLDFISAQRGQFTNSHGSHQHRRGVTVNHQPQSTILIRAAKDLRGVLGTIATSGYVLRVGFEYMGFPYMMG